jgi:hypothetical protein
MATKQILSNDKFEDIIESKNGEVKVDWKKLEDLNKRMQYDDSSFSERYRALLRHERYRALLRHLVCIDVLDDSSFGNYSIRYGDHSLNPRSTFLGLLYFRKVDDARSYGRAVVKRLKIPEHDGVYITTTTKVEDL